MKRRPPFYGVRQILQFNWMQYAAAALVIGVGLGAAFGLPLPIWMRTLILIGCGCAAYFAAASLVASWVIYDLSSLARFGWTAELGPQGAGRWLLLHTGLDESSEWLRQKFGAETGIVMDIFDPALMTEPSIRRARAIVARRQKAVGRAEDQCHVADWRQLPAKNQEFDTVFMIMAVHEFRQREALLRAFQEARRVLRPGGRVLLVEHLRDAANFAVFGPGFLHFWSRGSWLAIARSAGFQWVSERRLTPWVGVFVFENHADNSSPVPTSTSLAGRAIIQP